MSIHFQRKHRPMRELPLAAMIDVVFILIFFFMLTTSFIKIESMQLLLPSASKDTAISTPVTVIVLRGDDYIKFANRVIAPAELVDRLTQTLQTNPNMAFNVELDATVSLQRMVLVMDQINAQGGKSVSVQPLNAGAE